MVTDMADIARLERALRNAHASGDAVAAKRLAAEIKRVRSEGGFMQTVDDGVRAVANGLTFGMADRFSGFMSGDGTQAERDRSAAARERSPITSTLGEIAGSAVGLGKLAGAGATASRFIPAAATGVGRALGVGAAGAVDGIAANELMNLGYGREFGENIGMSAIAGAAAPAVAGAITAGASKALGAFNPKPATMSVDDLKAAASAAYKQADDAGIVFSPQASTRLRDTVQADMADFGFDPVLQPGANAAFKRLEEYAGQNVTMKGLDTARKIAGNAFDASKPSNNELARRISGRIDDAIANPQAGDVIMGDAVKGAAAIKSARELTARQKKLEKVAQLLERAEVQAGSTGSGGNIENATRQQIKRIITDPKFKRGFTADELAQVKKVALGTTTQNALRLAGKLSPQGNGLMMAIGAAHTALSPITGLPAMVAGYSAKKGAEAMTRANAETLKRLIANGGSLASITPVKNATQKAIEAKRAIVQQLLLSGALQTGAR